MAVAAGGPDLSAPLGRPPRVLVTGAGGPSGVCFLRALEGAAERYAADLDPNGAGLYLVPRSHRLLVPAGDAPGFAETVLRLCRALDVDVLVPTVDVELTALAEAEAAFAAAGVRVLVSPAAALTVCLDKWSLVQACSEAVRVPATALIGPGGQLLDPEGRLTGTESGPVFAAGFPVIAKPRHGSGSRGVTAVCSAEALAALPQDGSHLVQELLPGTEYSVDVLTDAAGARVVASVPRARDRTDSGVVVAGRVLDRPELSAFGAAAVRALGLRGVLNVQLREDRYGRPTLLEVNPRPPGGMSLTVSAGADMPRWAVAGLLGTEQPAHLAHRETAVVRHWQDVVLHPGELGAVAEPVGAASGGRTG